MEMINSMPFCYIHSCLRGRVVILTLHVLVSGYINGHSNYSVRLHQYARLPASSEVWQSLVEIKHYSVVYFDSISAFEDSTAFEAL